jgi:hypothetical protein
MDFSNCRHNVGWNTNRFRFISQKLFLQSSAFLHFLRPMETAPSCALKHGLLSRERGGDRKWKARVKMTKESCSIAEKQKRNEVGK